MSVRIQYAYLKQQTWLYRRNYPKELQAVLGQAYKQSLKTGDAGGRAQDEFARAVEGLQREQAALEAEAVALLAAAAAGRDYADAIAFAHERAKLLTAAQREGRAVTPELSAEIDRLAGAYVQAGNKAKEAADKLQQIEERGKKGAEALTNTFAAVLDGSKSAKEALAELLLEIGKAQLQKGLMGLFDGTGIAGFVGGLLGYSDGGYTGDGPKLEPAGVVHRGEFVFSKETVQRLGADNLARLHQSARKGYASGGLVGDGGKVARAAGGRPVDSARMSAPVVTINAPVTVNATGGSPEANADLAGKIAAQTERMFRGLIVEELVRQMRPGGMLR